MITTKGDDLVRSEQVKIIGYHRHLRKVHIQYPNETKDYVSPSYLEPEEEVLIQVKALLNKKLRFCLPSTRK